MGGGDWRTRRVKTSVSRTFEPWSLSVEAGGGARASLEGRLRPKKWFATRVRIVGGSTLPWNSQVSSLPLATVDVLAEFHGGVFLAAVLTEFGAMLFSGTLHVSAEGRLGVRIF